MRVCVFVDGENLRHTICELFPTDFDQRDYLPKSARWGDFFDHVVAEATRGKGERLRTYWYVVQHFDPYPRPLPPRNHVQPDLDQWAKTHVKTLKDYTIPPDTMGRTKTLREINEDLASNFEAMRGRFEGWTVLQNGIAQKHPAIEFRRSGSISYNLTNKRFGQEKTVDVNLAVDMVTFHENYDTAVIVSGDQDYVPAAQAVKNLGKRVVNIAFLARNGLLLPGGAKRLNQVTDWSIGIDWAKIKGLLAI